MKKTYTYVNIAYIQLFIAYIRIFWGSKMECITMTTIVSSRNINAEVCGALMLSFSNE